MTTYSAISAEVIETLNNIGQMTRASVAELIERECGVKVSKRAAGGYLKA